MKRTSTISKTAPLAAEKPIFCTQCGTPNTKDSKFCKECGESLVTTYTPKISSDPFVQAGLGKEDQIERLLDMAFWHNEAGNIGAALLACQAALALNDRSATAWSLMGCLYEKKGDLDKAIEAFEVVTNLNPDSVADAQKLEALRRGIHVKAVPQPANYRWVPPALARFVQEKPSAPAIGAAGAAVAIIILGLVAVHPLFSANNRYANADEPNISVARSAWSSGTPGTVTQDIAPSRTTAPHSLVASAPSPGGMANVITPSVAPRPDPFAGSESPIATTTPAVSHTAQRHETSDTAANKSLPPLPPSVGLPSGSDVQPIPSPDGGQAPITAMVAQVPQHTIPVTNIPPGDAQQAPGSDSLPGEDGAPPPASRISITVHGSPTDSTDNASPVPGDNGPVRNHLVLSQGSGASLQQTALNYQEQGNYSSAQAAYKRAIAAYQADLDAGRDSDAAVRGIQACETGLQICRQSQ
jgi:tetratricopeptide (TPR) repeat protein